MPTPSSQTLRLLQGSYVIERHDDASGIRLGTEVVAVVLGPDGYTVMRRDDAGEAPWSALWNGDEPHELEVVGMLSGIVSPIAAVGVPVWVASGYDGDLLFVQSARLDEACQALLAAGHEVQR